MAGRTIGFGQQWSFRTIVRMGAKDDHGFHRLRSRATGVTGNESDGASGRDCPHPGKPSVARKPTPSVVRPGAVGAAPMLPTVGHPTTFAVNGSGSVAGVCLQR